MWKPEHRRAAERSGLRYPSDLSDAEWAIAEPMNPPARHGGRKRSVNLREILNGIFYVLSTGCQCRLSPKDLPPKSTVHHYFMLWDCDGTLERIHHALYVEYANRQGERRSPTTAIIDTQSAKGAQKGVFRLIRRALSGQEGQGPQAAHSRRYPRPPVECGVHPASIQDSSTHCAGAQPPHASAVSLYRAHPWRRRLSRAEGRESSRENRSMEDRGCRTFCYRCRERTFAWISRFRRMARDFECYGRTVAAFIRLVMIRIMLRRLTNPCHST